ncbi:hypothetical protein NMY22_g13633 [Coprinellus aureogranulatus]|nr:hypothetical protein NMY22_g13633 [Coprinellus aureogranulatus]
MVDTPVLPPKARPTSTPRPPSTSSPVVLLAPTARSSSSAVISPTSTMSSPPSRQTLSSTIWLEASSPTFEAERYSNVRIIQALKEYKNQPIAHKVKIFIRRGGPNYQEVSKAMRLLAESLGVPIRFFGPDTHITEIVPLALCVDLYKSKTSNVPTSGLTSSPRLPFPLPSRYPLSLTPTILLVLSTPTTGHPNPYSPARLQRRLASTLPMVANVVRFRACGALLRSVATAHCLTMEYTLRNRGL